MSFCLYPAEHALRTYERDPDPDPNPPRLLGETLEPGGAVAAVLVEHVWCMPAATRSRTPAARRC